MKRPGAIEAVVEDIAHRPLLAMDASESGNAGEEIDGYGALRIRKQRSCAGKNCAQPE